MREGDLGREAEGKIMRDQMGEVGEVSGRRCDLGWSRIYHGLVNRLELRKTFILFRSLRSAIGTPPMK